MGVFCKKEIGDKCDKCKICHKGSITLIEVTENAFGYPHFTNNKLVELQEKDGEYWVLTTLSGSPDVDTTYYYKCKDLEDLVKTIATNLSYAREMKKNPNNEVWIRYEGK